MQMKELTRDAIDLLKVMISIPSFSREEDKLASFLFDHLEKLKLSPIKFENNVWTRNLHYDSSKPTILLNSHIDTVKENELWTYDPFLATTEGEKIIGLGSNDAGASVVSLLACFMHYYNKPNLKYNLVLALTAEEEISGDKGIVSLLKEIGEIDLGIIGEPTMMQMAIAEKGLIVLDCFSYGEQSHAALGSLNNAIYNCLNDINWFKSYEFSKESKYLGKVNMAVTQINSGTQHNVIPVKCHFVVDVRTNECYKNSEVIQIIKDNTNCDVKARSLRLNPSSISIDHPIVQKGLKMGLKKYGSHTLSDQALLDFLTIKIGPGNSQRSHTANEYILLKEIEIGISTYIKLLDELKIE